MADMPKENEIYRHFKGNLYRIVTIAHHAETGERVVVYQALYGDYAIYVRELSSFMSRVDRRKYPNAKQTDRFVRVPQVMGQEEACRREGTVCVETVHAQEQSQAAKQRPEQTQMQKELAGGRAENLPAQTDVGEGALDPFLLQFLDADTYEEKLNLLVALHARVTDDMINTMAVSLDVEINDGDIEDRYEALKTCLLTLEKYECNRLR